MNKVGRPRGKSLPKAVIGTTTAAELGGVCNNTVRKWVDEGMLPGFRVAGTEGSHRKIRRRDLALFLADNGMPVPEELKHYVEER